MRSLFYSFLGYFLTIPGVLLMAALDSSLVFFLPLGIDFVVIIMAARSPELFWAYAVLATIGSVAGARLTFWIGAKVGEHGLERLIKRSRLDRIRERVSQGAAVSIAALALIPPPFPYTAFVLTSGAFHLDTWSFFVTLGAVRLVRFGIESALAARYGRGIIVWMQSPIFEFIVGTFIVLAVVGTLVSAIALWTKARRREATERRGANGVVLTTEERSQRRSF